MTDPRPDAADIAEAFGATASPIADLDDLAAALTAVNIARARCDRLADALTGPQRIPARNAVQIACVRLDHARGNLLTAMREIAADA